MKNLFLRIRAKRLGLSFPLLCKTHDNLREDFQGALAQSAEGDKLKIVFAPAYGKSFCILNLEINRVVGTLNETLGEKLIRYRKKETAAFDGEIVRVTGGGEKFFGCNFLLFDTDTPLSKEELTSIFYER